MNEEASEAADGVRVRSLLRAVPTMPSTRKSPTAPTDVVSLLHGRKESEPPPAITFHAAPGMDPERMRVGAALVDLARSLLDVLHPDEAERLAVEAHAVIASDLEIDDDEYERLTGEAPLGLSELAALRIQSVLKAFSRRRELLADTLSEDTVRELLGVSSEFAPNWLRSPRRLLAILDFGQYRFPLWQFDAAAPDGVVGGLSVVLAELDPVPPLQQLAWFSLPQPELGGSAPRDSLCAGDVDAVRVAARVLRYSIAGSA